MRVTLSNLLEYIVRLLSFSFPSVISWYKHLKVGILKRNAKNKVKWRPEAVLECLNREIPRSSDILLHSSMAGLGEGVSPFSVLKLFQQFCGAERTLLLPSHPVLKSGKDGVLEYDPERSPSSVGLIAEIARRQVSFERSKHPLSSVVAQGPSAHHYLLNNLNDLKPLPHGVYSPYARLAESDGYTVCFGVPFGSILTMTHVAEEILDDQHPVVGLFEELTIRIAEKGVWKDYCVRRRKEQLQANISMRNVRRDLVECGAVKCFVIDGRHLDIVSCRKVVEYMRQRALETGYPYMFVRLKNGKSG